MKSRIKNLIDSSKEVILDCCLENGAIVAANSAKDYYPREVKNYFSVWPRDASFTCVAADVLGLKGIQERFFRWVMNRAEGWRETGLLYEKYHPNGSKAEERFQADQTGSVLWAIWHHFMGGDAEEFKDLVTESADGLCKIWDKNHFTLVTNDLWEERLAFPDLQENFTYSLAACIRGLLAANSLFPDREYVKAAEEMRKVLLNNTRDRGFFYRSSGELSDERIDASLMGLLWPFEVVEATNPLFKKTLELIEEKLIKDHGVHRYEHDEYDGWMFHKAGRNKGAGFWPLLNLWMSIVLDKMGEKEKAAKYYQKVVDSVDRYIPEQIFKNRIQKSISPLCWSHAMFILATRELELSR
ncbi:MAG: glycoside hydrolase family 15 protein [Candidatus Altiarchaeota archaeon]|nr:glycoside hydrolase family 15 protein [Candidatus Altiarchaeota archaeon]